MLQTFDERNRDLIVNVGGRLTHRDQAGVSPFDSAVQGLLAKQLAARGFAVEEKK